MSVCCPSRGYTFGPSHGPIVHSVVLLRVRHDVLPRRRPPGGSTCKCKCKGAYPNVGRNWRKRLAVRWLQHTKSSSTTGLSQPNSKAIQLTQILVGSSLQLHGRKSSSRCAWFAYSPRSGDFCCSTTEDRGKQQLNHRNCRCQSQTMGEVRWP